jgi:hypothetical protein
MANPPFPTNYVGSYIAQINNELKNYETRLSQDDKGIYNADQNDFSFINSAKNRRLVQDLFGDGLIGDAFKVVGTGAANDFTITLGGTVSNPPTDLELSALDRAYLGGYQLITGTAGGTTSYNNQNTDINSGLGWSGGSPPVLTTPGAPRTDEVYLHVYKQETDGVDDADLIPSTFGLTASVTNREKVIIEIGVAEGGSTPANNIDGNGVVHYYLHIATLNRTASANITSGMVVLIENAIQLGRIDLDWVLPTGAPDDDPPAPGYEAGSSPMTVDYLAFGTQSTNVVRAGFQVPRDIDTGKGIGISVSYRPELAGAPSVARFRSRLDGYIDGDPVGTPTVSTSLDSDIPIVADTDIHHYLDTIASSVWAGLVENDLMTVEFERRPGDAQDTLAAYVRVYKVSLYYSRRG